MPAAVASRCYRRRFQQLACACGSYCQDRCLRPLLRGVVDEGSNSWFAPRLTCGSTLEVSRDAAAAEEEKLVNCAAEQSEYCSICAVTPDPCGDLPFKSWGRWQCLRGGADGLNGCYAACGCGTEYWCGALLGGDVWQHALGDGAHCPLAAQRGDGARCLSQIWYHFTRPKPPGQNSRGSFFGRIFEIILEGSHRSKMGIGLNRG
jgi:hypothetical protein